MIDEARSHAVAASELLRSVERFSDRLENLTADERLEMAVTKGFSRANASLEWSTQLAIAHALAALALTQTDERSEVVAQEAG